MTPSIHNAALRAAARLALSAAVPAFVFACGGTDAQDGQESTDSTQNTGTTEGDLKSGTPKVVKTYCAAEHCEETTESCCKAEVASATFPKDPHWSQNPDTRVDALTRGCCTILANAAAKNGGLFPERGECCPAIGWGGAPSCSPWGPPVPPKMPATFLMVA